MALKKIIMRKKNLLFLSVLAIVVISVVSCVKSATLPTKTPSPATIFTAGKLNHTKDSVNVGDTIYLNATGTVWDTTQSISVFVTATSGDSTATAFNPTGTFVMGSSVAPVKVNRVIGALNASGLYAWTATITLPGATGVAHKKRLAITSTYIYQLSLSSQLPASVTSTDAGIKIKTVYIK